MKLDIKITFISLLLLCLTSIFSIKLENYRSEKTSKDSDSTETRVKSTKLVDTRYTLNKDTFRDLLKNVFMQFTEMKKFEKTKNCIDEIFDKNPDNSAISVIWNELTTKTFNNNAPVDKNWLLTFSDALKPFALESKESKSKDEKLSCDILVKNNLLTNEQINVLGVTTLSKNVRRLIENYINAARKETEGRMNTFITSSASTYRNDPMIDKDLFAKLNNKGKVPQKDTSSKKF